MIDTIEYLIHKYNTINPWVKMGAMCVVYWAYMLYIHLHVRKDVGGLHPTLFFLGIFITVSMTATMVYVEIDKRRHK